MENYFVYILLCSDNTFYTGITNNLARRFEEHAAGLLSGYTHDRRPVRLVYFESFHEVSDALLWEKQIKNWSQNKKKALIERNFQRVHEFSRSHQHFSTRRQPPRSK